MQIIFLSQTKTLPIFNRNDLLFLDKNFLTINFLYYFCMIFHLVYPRHWPLWIFPVVFVFIYLAILSTYYGGSFNWKCYIAIIVHIICLSMYMAAKMQEAKDLFSTELFENCENFFQTLVTLLTLYSGSLAF